MNKSYLWVCILVLGTQYSSSNLLFCLSKHGIKALGFAPFDSSSSFLSFLPWFSFSYFFLLLSVFPSFSLVLFFPLLFSSTFFSVWRFSLARADISHQLSTKCFIVTVAAVLECVGPFDQGALSSCYRYFHSHVMRLKSWSCLIDLSCIWSCLQWLSLLKILLVHWYVTDLFVLGVPTWMIKE